MAQVTTHLPDDAATRAGSEAKALGESVGCWIAPHVVLKVETTWPRDVLAALGSFPDFPDLDTLRRGCGHDAEREAPE